MAVELTPLEQTMREMTAPGEMFELTTRIVNNAEVPFFANTPANLKAFYQYCLQHDTLEFLVEGDLRLTYREVWEQVCRCANALVHQFGVAKGDRVALVTRNHVEWVISYMAATSIGAIIVPMNAWWQTEELDQGLRDCGATLVIADAERLARLDPLRQQLALTIIAIRTAGPHADGVHDWQDVMAGAGDEMPEVEVLDEDDALLMYTSGSTGYPKGAISSHRAVLSTIMAWALLGLAGGMTELPEGKQPAILLTVPLFHVTGSHNIFLLSMVIGRKIVFMHKWDVTEAMRLIEKEYVTYFNGVPTMSMELMRAPNRDQFDLSSIRDIAGGGAPRPASQVAEIRKAFPDRNVAIGYGLTETNALGAANTREGYQAKPASTGKAIWPLVRFRILNDDGEEMPVGEVGEICIQAASNCRGYWKRMDDTAAAFRNGWFHSGDLGYLDEEGYLFIVDRKKEIILRGGENISCLEVEEALYKLPYVAEAAVFGLPDDRLGELVGAVIHPAGGRQPEAEQVRADLRSHLAAFKIPQKIWFEGAPLPRIASEKVDRKGLRERYRAWVVGKETDEGVA